jgi:hypothetical protein
MTYLELVNSVLRRLREDEVTSVTDTTYSKLIGTFVNDAKQEVENSYDWNALTDTLTATTTAGLFNYVLEGSDNRFKVIDVWNDTEDTFLKNRDQSWMTRSLLTGVQQKGAPEFYCFNGEDSNGDTQVDLYPVPDKSYDIRFNIYKPQADLSTNADRLLVPALPVVLGAYARALAERGEDAGIGSQDAYALFLKALGDSIAIESQRYVEESNWVAR